MFNSSFCLALYLCIRCPRKILLRLGVETRLVAICDELAVLPYVDLVLGALLALSKAQAERFQLLLVEGML